MPDDDVTENCWVVHTDSLPFVRVEPVRTEGVACSFGGVYETEQEAWRAAEEHIAAYLQECHAARRIVVADLDRRIEEAERWWTVARTKART